MPEPTDPFARLDRLAPSVDGDAATAAFGRRRAARARRRRAVTGGAVAASVLVVVGLGAALAAPSDDGQRVLAGSTTAVPVTTAPVPRPVDVVTTTTSDGMTLALTTPPEARVGERLWVDVVFTNDRDEAVLVTAAAPCREPVGALAGTVGAVDAVKADTGFLAFDPSSPDSSRRDEPRWTGDLDELPGALDGGVDPKVYPGRAEDQLPMLGTACDWVARPPERVDAGASVARRIAIDLRWATPGSVDGESLEVLASTGDITDLGGADLGKVTVQQPVRLHDTVFRQPSYDAALAADGIAAAPTLPEWIEETIDMGPDVPPGFVQQYTTSLTWWNGAWEAWLVPGRGDGQQTDPLRIRFDPERMEVVDVRTSIWGQTPSDDPDQPQPDPSEPVEDVHYHED